MPEVYASNEVTAELLDPVSGSVITTVSIPYRRDLTISERPVYAQRGYHRSNTLSAAHLRSLGSVSLRKDADSLALAAEIKRWQKGVVFYALSSDLKGQRYRHPHLRVTFTNADGSTDVVTAYNVKLSDRSLSAPDGGIVGDSISLDVLGGFEPKDGGYEPVRALDFHRTGPATYLSTAGTLTTAGDGVARIGVPWVVRRNLYRSTNSPANLMSWSVQNGATTSFPNRLNVTSASHSRSQLEFSTGGSATARAPYVGTFTLRFKVRGSLPTFYLNIDPGNCTLTSSGQVGTISGISPTEWLLVTATINITAAGSVWRAWLSNASAGAGWYEFDEIQLEEGSNATPFQATTEAGAVDLTHPLNGAGLVLEGSFTNSLANPDAPATQTVSLAPGTYTVYLDGTGSVAVTGTGITTVSGATPATNAIPYTFSLAGTQSITFTVSGSVTRFGCVNLPFRPSHITGTKQPDLCGIVPPHNLAKYSQDFNQSVWIENVAGSLTSTTATAPDGSATAGTINMAAGAGAGINQTISGITFDGEARTFPIWLKGALGGEVMVLGLARSDTGTMVSQTAIALTNTWQRYYVTTTSAAGQGLQLRLARSSTSGSFHFWGAQLTEGSHPGTYVRTTDTPIPAPVSPALDPAWQQNGRVRFRVLPPPLSTGKSYNLIGLEHPDSVNAAVFRLYRKNTDTDNRIGFDRKHNSTTGTASQAGRGQFVITSPSIYDGAPHDVILEWTNEINESTGVREMWQRLYIDGTLVASQDVAALYGASAWAEIDSSRLVSDGNVFAVLGDVIPEWPTSRAGYRQA